MPVTNLTITVAIVEDADAVLSILKEAANWIHAKQINQWDYIRSGGQDEQIIEDIKGGKTYVARRDNQIVGTFLINDEPNEWDAHLWEENANVDQAIYLHKLAIVRDPNNKGIGEQMIRWVEGEFKKAGKKYLRLDCVAENERLNQYYQEVGFTKIAENHDFSLYEKLL